MSDEGTQIILYNPSRRGVLMYQRDNFDHIPYPGMWALPGGMMEDGETPLECIVREIEEELGVSIDPSTVQHLATRNCSFGIEHTFTAAADFDLGELQPTEGQDWQWFDQAATEATLLAYADNEILDHFWTTPLPEPVTTHN